ncbi:hypothetical protein D3H55_02060 [Bacillus salacetis]|uniref:Uncharacterized protein n=1 Tax=Bacillus salacetis TaxID=2315464 RepID=A0A3A1R5B6_9BACI|nr:hypothetical protein D3H55_02060 [Bacillus salacetis]
MILSFLPLLLTFAAIVFIIYYIPILVKDSKKKMDSTESIKNNLDKIVKQNEELIFLLKKNNEKG